MCIFAGYMFMLAFVDIVIVGQVLSYTFLNHSLKDFYCMWRKTFKYLLFRQKFDFFFLSLCYKGEFLNSKFSVFVSTAASLVLLLISFVFFRKIAGIPSHLDSFFLIVLLLLIFNLQLLKHPWWHSRQIDWIFYQYYL